MKLEARKRDVGAASSLRRGGLLPAVVYNRHLNLSVSVEFKAFDRVFRSQGTSSVIDLEVDGGTVPVLVKAVQMDKRRRVPLHVDFFAITADRAVTVNVRLEYTGTAAGTRDGGQLDVQRREIHISVLPRFIPNHLEVDVAALAIGDSLHVRDLRALLPDEATILDDLDLAIVAVVPPRVLSEDEAADGAGDGEPEVIQKGAEDADG